MENYIYVVYPRESIDSFDINKGENFTSLQRAEDFGTEAYGFERFVISPQEVYKS